MAWVWTDQITETNWQTLDVQRVFTRALSERMIAVGGNAYSTHIPTPDVGDYVFDVVAAQTFVWGAIALTDPLNQNNVYPSGFIKTAPSGDNINSACWADAAEFFTTAGLNEDGFTRKYPREMETLSATQYTDESAIIDGHHARCLADGLVYLRSGGQWVLPSTPTPPDTVTAYGVPQPGDYMGVWQLAEIRACFNLMTKTLRHVSTTEAGGTGGHGENDWGNASVDVVKGECQANYTETNGSVSGLHTWTRLTEMGFADTDENGNPVPNPIYHAAAHSQSGVMHVVQMPTLLTANRTTYAFGERPDLSGAPDGSDQDQYYQNTFNNYGLPVTLGSWGVYGSYGFGGAELGFAGVAGFPSQWPATPTPSGTNIISTYYSGFAALLVAYLDWDFQYK